MMAPMPAWFLSLMVAKYTISDVVLVVTIS